MRSQDPSRVQAKREWVQIDKLELGGNILSSPLEKEFQMPGYEKGNPPRGGRARRGEAVLRGYVDTQSVMRD